MHATPFRAMGLDKRLAAGATTLASGKMRGLLTEVMNNPASVTCQLPQLRGEAGRSLFTRDGEGLALEVLADVEPTGKTIHLSVTRYLPGGNLRLTVAGELEPGRLLLVGGWPVPEGERGQKVALLIARPRVVRR
jgi:hypothetical protein